MAFYETVFIARQDISTVDVDKLTDTFSNIITDYKGEIIKTEYWGLRDLAYQILKNNKGHYVLLGIKAEPDGIKEMERKMKLNDNVVRFLTLKVEEISKEPSPILKPAEQEEKKLTEKQEVIRVTA